jgi:hypothetical protein
VARLLNTTERVSEVMFGVFMALTFTGTVSAATQGREEIRSVLVGALGCNLAWGLADAVMYLVNLVSERGRGVVSLRSLHHARDAAAGRDIVAGALPPLVAGVMRPEELDAVRERLMALPDVPDRPWLRPRDFLAALAILLVVFLSTFPLVIPFLVLDDASRALRWSHGVALLLLFGCGARLGAHAGRPPLRSGLAIMLVGVGLVALIIALGG